MATAAPTERRSLWSALETRHGDDDIAFADMASGKRITWTDLADRVDRIATELAARGLRHGDRVAMLTPPGVELAAAIYGVWRAGGVAVVADRQRLSFKLNARLPASVFFFGGGPQLNVLTLSGRK